MRHMDAMWLHVAAMCAAEPVRPQVCRACEVPDLTVLPSLRGRVFLASLRASRGLSCELASILRGGYSVNNVTGSRV